MKRISFTGEEEEWVRIKRSLNASCHIMKNNDYTLCGHFALGIMPRLGADCCKKCMRILRAQESKEKKSVCEYCGKSDDTVIQRVDMYNMELYQDDTLFWMCLDCDRSRAEEV